MAPATTNPVIVASPKMPMLPRLLPLIGTVLFVLVAFCWRPWLQRRRFGSAGVLLFRSGRLSQHVRDALAVLLIALLLGQAVVAALGPEPALPVRVGGAARCIVQAMGASLVLGGFALLVTAQLQLGAAWRIGIDESARSGLVTHGVYRFCRNPIYLAIIALIAGYALLLPTVLSAALLLGGCFGFRQQTIAEEAYLARAYGDDFLRYAR